jgi:molybdopterin synthase sulfur carrier subunit
MVQITYFAKVRETVGLDGESRDVAPATSIAELVERMVDEADIYARAFADRAKLRFAIDQKMVNADAVLDGVQELAIFPPVTGG